MKTNDNTNRLKTYKIKNHDSGKTYSVKAVSYADAKMKYNNHILKDSIAEDADESQYFEQAKRLRGKQLTQGKYEGYRIRRVTKSVTGKLWYAISDGLNDRTISHDEMLKGMNARNIDLFDSITEDAATEYEVGKYNKEWGVFAKRSRAWVAFGTKEKMTELAKRLNKLEKKQRQDSIAEDSIKSYKIKNHDSGKTYSVKAVSYVDAIKKYNEHILKDSIAEDAETYSYQFPSLTAKDLEKANDYELLEVKKVGKDIVLKGSLENLKRFAEKYLGYKLVKEYLTKDSITEDADLTGKIVKYNGMTVKVLRKLTEQEKQKRAHLNNPDAGDYYEVETTSKAIGTSKFIVWEARLRDSITEDADFYGATQGSEKADDILFALQVMYGEPKYSYADFQKMNLSQAEVNEAITYVKKKGYNKHTYFDSITEDADIAQNDIKSSYLPEDANADNIQYLGFNEKRKLSFYSYGDRYFVHHDLEGRTEEIDKATVQKILKKNILGEIDENDLINKEPQAEEIVSDAFTEDASTSVYAFKQGQRADAFKQYLRDRGLKFEPSQDGRLVVFVVFNADEAVDRRAIEITRTIRDTFEEDASIKDGLINAMEFINGVNNSSKDYYEKRIRFFGGGGGVVVTLTSLVDLYVTDIDTNETVKFTTLKTNPRNHNDWAWELRDKLLDLDIILGRGNWKKELKFKDSKERGDR